MGEIRMTGEIRTDYDCEANGLPAERWAEPVFKIGEEEIAMKIKIVSFVPGFIISSGML